MPVPASVTELVKRFGDQIEAYKNGKYNETQVRVEFIDPFFKALGWDIHNEQGLAPAYKDVIHEDAIKIGFETKAPDYCFRVGGTRKFFLEAKKPAVNIKDDVGPAFQVRRYAWSSKLPLSILTDFEEFAVYDCRIKPQKGDKPSVGRVFYCRCDEYEAKWDDIAGIFSKEAVLKGSFDKFAESNKKKKGTTEVDDAFLEEIESWREILAKNIALRNPKLSVRELNFSVQQTIDRIIFLRICEDRGIEPYGRLQGLLNGENTYKRLTEIFCNADDRYNSGLFHFKEEKDRAEEPDKLTLALKIDDDALKSILKNLYYPDSPYEFSVLPADILGQVYEQFLGKVIRLTKEHHAKVEEKPEVRKAGGVYYTPKYIVDYIVENTVGKLLEGKEPKEITKLRILDPACGSGSFLIQAYQFLLDWHLDWYIADGPKKHANGRPPRVFQNSRNEWRLTTTERKKILLNNIYGVDIDSQAVEVTKLSLLLKVLEGESDQSLNQNFALFHERALPDLQNNIKCGNSLIAPDFYVGQQLGLLDNDERYKINAFDWKEEFQTIFAQGGFDVIIGNPPYLYSASKAYMDYFSYHYKLSQYQTDYYVFFIERALELGKKHGRLSFIVSDSWLNSQYFSKLREHLLAKSTIESLTVFDYCVFTGAAIENSIFSILIDREPKTIPIYLFSSPTNYTQINQVDPENAIKIGLIDPRRTQDTALLLRRIEEKGSSLGNYLSINRGVHAYRTDGYGKSKFGKGPQTKKDKDEKSYHADKKLDKTYLPELKGKDVFRFTKSPTSKYISYGPWLAEPREPEFFLNPKIVLRKILGMKLSGTYIKDPMVIDQSLYVLISKNNDEKTLLYILGILMSSLGAWYLRNKHSIFDVLYPWYTKKQLAEFPINFTESSLVEHIKAILQLQIDYKNTKLPGDKMNIERQIRMIETQIDSCVFKIYGISKDEITQILQEKV